MKKLVMSALALTGLATSATAAQAETVLTKAELTAATQQAESAGTIESIEASGGSQEAVEAAFSPGEMERASIQRPAAALNLVVMHGQFEDVPNGDHGDPSSFPIEHETHNSASRSWSTDGCFRVCVPEGTGNHYTMMTSGGGTWCWYFGTGNELKACRSDFAWQATQVEAGGEIATEEKPAFASSSNNDAEWTNHTWHTWNFARAHVTTPGLCWSALNGAPGNMYYDTCSGNMET